MAGPIFLILGGALLVWLGAEILVRGSSRIARRYGVTPFMIGATIVAFGTSAPELVVSFIAHVTGESGMSLGNVLGSNVCNLALVLGVTALVLPVAVRGRTLRLALPLVLLAECVFWFVASDGLLGVFDGVVLLGSFAAIYWVLVRGPSEPGPEIAHEGTLRGEIAYTVLGLVGLVAGARIFVLGAEDFAVQVGMEKTTVGATVVAFGTSLPELVTSVVAAARGHLDISLGNLLGSNLFNALLVGGSLAIAGSVPVDPEVFYHVYWMLAVTAAVFPLAIYRAFVGRDRGPRIDRVGGAVLTIGYVVYLWGSL